MASIAVGPGGISIEGDHSCSNNTFLADQGGPFGALVNMLIDQRLTALKTLEYDPIAFEMDRHMPMRASTVTNIINTNHYKLDVGYDSLLNQESLIDIAPQIGNYTNTQQFRDSCGLPSLTGIGSTANVNSEACNPNIDGPMPAIGRENYGRNAYVSRLPIVPLCMGDWVNKEEFYSTYAALLRTAQNGVITRFGAGQHRWMVSRTRFNIAPVQQSLGNGSARLVENPALFDAFKFGRVPQHWGSPDWFASMLRYSEVPSRRDVTVQLPTAILQKYKEDFAQRQMGLNLYATAGNITRDINGYIATLQNENFVYQDKITGRKITFVATSNPIYVEVEETGPNIGEWKYQEPYVKRPSETPNQIMRRENPNWGRACSCSGKVLAAIVTVSADGGDKPFYKEPLPDNNPDPRMASLFSAYASKNGIDLKSSLGMIYPATARTRVLTGVEAQVFVLDPANARARASGQDCNVANNILSTWVAGFTEIAAQFVEENPRELANFLLLMPQDNVCVDLATSCEIPTEITAAGDIEPGLEPFYRQPVPVPTPIDPPTPPAGTISIVGSKSTITAPCTGTKVLSFRVTRNGGSAGSLTVNIAATPTAHGGTPPSTVTLADGVTEGVVSWTIPAWVCDTDTQTSENYNLTFSGAALDPDTFTTRLICIKCAKNCPTTCEVNEGGCATC